MERTPFTITMRKDLLKKVDSLVDGTKIRNRSHALEYVTNSFFKPKIKKALILAGGKGVKMRPLTYEMPKAMLPVKGKPILEYTIENLKNNDIRDIYIAIGYLGQKIKDYFQDGSRFNVRINYIEERKDLGTAGALKQAIPYFESEPFLLIWGDVLAEIDFSDMIDFHLDHEAIMTIALTSVSDPTDYGSVRVHRDNIVEFTEKPKKSPSMSYLVSSGVHIIDPKISEYLPKSLNSMLEKDVIPELIKEKNIKGYIFEGKWFDVGTPDIYNRAIKEWTNKK